MKVMLEVGDGAGGKAYEHYRLQSGSQQLVQRVGGPWGESQSLQIGWLLAGQGPQRTDRLPQGAIGTSEWERRPVIVHQAGRANIEQLRANYTAAAVEAETVAFIEDMAAAYADADLVIARAGAMTVSEIACVGVASILVPFPHAVDDHQTTNARFLVEAGGAWLVPQSELTPQGLAERLRRVQRNELQEMAIKAKQMEKTQAVAAVVAACEKLAKVHA